MIFLLIMLQIALLILALRLMSRTGVSHLLSTALLFYALLWYIIPILLGQVVGRDSLFAALVNEQVYAEFAVIETLALIVTLLLLFRPHPYFDFIVRQSVSHVEIGPKVILAVLLGGTVISLVVSRQFMGLLGTTYLEQTAAPVTSLDEQWFGSYGGFSFVQSLITAFAYLCLTVKWPQRSLTYSLVTLAALALTLNSVLVAVSGGARIAMLVFPLLLIMHAREHDWPIKKMLWIAIGLSVVIIPVGGSLTVAISELRQRDYSVEGIVEYSQNLLSDAGDTNDLGGAVLDEVIKKFDHISTGAFLVKALGAGYAGWKPYQGAFAAVIPRRILSDKPVPGSVDGTFLGHPSRLIPAQIGYGSDSASMGAGPAAITIWQFGFGGLLLLVVANGINLYFVNSLLLSPSLIARILGISLLGMPSLATLLASPDVLIMNAERILVIYAFVYLAIKFLSHYHQRASWSRQANFHPKIRLER